MVLIIEDRKHLSKLFEKMSIGEILKDMVETHKERLRWNGITSEYCWLTQRFKIALLEVVKRQVL